MPDELRPATWDDVIRHEAKQAKVPPQLALAIAETESGFDPMARSPKGARGIFQLMPDTAAELGVDPDDPVQNIRGGLKYFRQQLDAHGGDVNKALTAYNWGPGNLSKGGEPPEETRAYVSRILSRLGPQQAPTSPSSGPPPAKLAPITLKESVMGVGQPPPGAPSAGPAEGSSVFDKGLVSQIASGFDPRTRTGRRNIAGGVGAAAATGALVATAPVSLPVLGATAVLGSALGAAGGGMLAESGEQIAGTAPPSGTEALKAGGEQAAYDVAGHAMLWPVRGLGRRLAATRVGQFASQAFDEALTGAKNAVTSARQVASDALTSAREAGDVAISGAKRRADETITGVKRAAEEHVGKAKQFAATSEEAVTSRYERIAKAPPTVTPRAAGERAQAVIQGPARQARDEIGEMVEQAAQSGPDVDIKALKLEAQRILGEEIAPSQAAFPKGEVEISPAVQELQALAANFPPEKVATLSPSQKVEAEAIHKALADAQKEQAGTVLKHPAMSVLGRILAADDKVPFHSAHLFKRELDDAIGTAWDRSVRSRVTNITKVMRGSLRDALSVHEPYNQATAAYQAIAPLYTKGLAPKLRQAAIDSPESIVRMIKPNDPTKVTMLRDLLVTQPEQVGQGRQGQHAWDSVRSAWTHQNLITGGVDKIDDRIAKLDPEFLNVMYGDGPGLMVLDNLRSISQAYKSAVERGAATITESQAVAKGATDFAAAGAKREIAGARAGKAADIKGARQFGRELVGQNLNLLEGTKHEAKKFVKSSLVRSKDEDLVSDALRAGGLGIGSIWGAQSIARLMLRGPKSKDLLQYAAYSPEGTQLLVRALTGPEPGVALADLLRMSGIGEVISEGTATPPPVAEGAVGAPPP